MPWAKAARIYECAFVGLYQFGLRRWSGDPTVLILVYALFSTSPVMNFNFLAIGAGLIGFSVPAHSAYFVLGLACVVNYACLIRRRRYLLLLTRFRKCPDSQQQRWRRLGVGYLVASWVSWTGVAVLWVMTVPGR